MTWKEKIRELLLQHSSGMPFRDLFEAVEVDIPLHKAFRRAALDGNPQKSMISARLRIFQIYLTDLNVETDPPPISGRRRYDYRYTSIRLPLANGLGCQICLGELLKVNARFWCLRCKDFTKPVEKRLHLVA